MADLRSEKKNVRQERRQDPRLEFHCNAMVLGLDGVKTVTEISFGGIFIEVEELDRIEIGQIIMINVKLPTESKAMKLKAKAINRNHGGVGCQFVSLNESQKDAICMCFEYFKDTLPAKCK